MELRDLIVTPIWLAVIYLVAYSVRSRVTDRVTRQYFIPALTVRLLGALAVGFIYQFYYNGGDTYNYHTHGSRHLWDAFFDSPWKGFKLFFRSADLKGIYEYASKIAFYNDPQSYTIVQIAAIFDLLTFSSYSATALFFALFSFVGMWLFFLTFYRQYPQLHKYFAIAAFFIPSVFFWGSGLLKDTITLGCLGVITYLVFLIFLQGQRSLSNIFWLILFFAVLYSIKIYILLTFIPAAIFWIIFSKFSKVRSLVIKIMAFPFVIIFALGGGWLALVRAAEDNPKYNVNKLAETARITAYDIGFYTGRDAGSGYSLGELDGTWGSMFKLTPQAINVSLFRPYLWEVGNPLMLLSAMESFFFLVLTAYFVIRWNVGILPAFKNPNIIFSLSFSLVFAFAVGVSTYNFGTLVRYKIPMMPFYLATLILLWYYTSLIKKEERLSRHLIN